MRLPLPATKFSAAIVIFAQPACPTIAALISALLEFECNLVASAQEICREDMARVTACYDQLDVQAEFNWLETSQPIEDLNLLAKTTADAAIMAAAATKEAATTARKKAATMTYGEFPLHQLEDTLRRIVALIGSSSILDSTWRFYDLGCG